MKIDINNVDATRMPYRYIVKESVLNEDDDALELKSLSKKSSSFFIFNLDEENNGTYCLSVVFFPCLQERNLTNVTTVAKPSANPPTWSHIVGNTLASNLFPVQLVEGVFRGKSTYVDTTKPNM